MSIYSFTYSLICPFIHLLTHSFVHLFIYLLTHLSIYSFTYSLICSFTYSLICPFINLLTHSFVHLFIYLLTHLSIYSFMHWITSLFILYQHYNRKCPGRYLRPRLNGDISKPDRDVSDSTRKTCTSLWYVLYVIVRVYLSLSSPLRDLRERVKREPVVS